MAVEQCLEPRQQKTGGRSAKICSWRIEEVGEKIEYDRQASLGWAARTAEAWRVSR